MHVHYTMYIETLLCDLSYFSIWMPQLKIWFFWLNFFLCPLCISIYMYNRVSQKTKNFSESWHMMGEVIIKWFYFYYFRFRPLFERALLKTQITIIALCACAKTVGRMKCKNAAENYKKKKSRIFLLDQNMKKDVNSQEMLCNKISENPQIFLK